MSIADELNLLWQMNGEEPHETQGSPHQEHQPHQRQSFDPLSAGAAKAVQQVRENLGYKQSMARPFVEALSNLGNELLRTSDIENGITPRQSNSNPYAEQDEQFAQNMKIMQFLSEQEEARKMHEERAQHNRALEEYYGRKPLGRQYAPSALGKLYQERERAVEEFGEDSPQVSTYDLAIQKNTTDSDTRRRSLFASNLEKSMSAIDPHIITQYSGPQGQFKLKVEQANDLAGHPSEDYLKYKEALVANEFETSELRQFFGDSITPEVRKHLQFLSNPASLGLSPQAAKRQVERSRSIVTKQLQTYRGALTGTKEHRGIHHTNVEPESHSQQMVTISNKKTGETRQVTLEEARKLGATSE